MLRKSGFLHAGIGNFDVVPRTRHNSSGEQLDGFWMERFNTEGLIVYINTILLILGYSKFTLVSAPRISVTFLAP